MGFCNWYHLADIIPRDYPLNHSFLRNIGAYCKTCASSPSNFDKFEMGSNASLTEKLIGHCIGDFLRFFHEYIKKIINEEDSLKCVHPFMVNYLDIITKAGGLQ